MRMDSRFDCWEVNRWKCINFTIHHYNLLLSTFHSPPVPWMWTVLRRALGRSLTQRFRRCPSTCQSTLAWIALLFLVAFVFLLHNHMNSETIAELLVLQTTRLLWKRVLLIKSIVARMQTFKCMYILSVNPVLPTCAAFNQGNLTWLGTDLQYCAEIWFALCCCQDLLVLEEQEVCSEFICMY